MGEQNAHNKNIDFDDWTSFESYLERNAVTAAITDVLIGLFNEKPWPENVSQYMYHKLGDRAERRVRRRLAELNRKIEMLTEEIENLSLIRDNHLKYSVYKPFVDRKLAEKTRNKKRRENVESDGVSQTTAATR